MDVDGVLTDGKLFNVPAPDGSMAETKGFDSQDGIGLQWLLDPSTDVTGTVGTYINRTVLAWRSPAARSVKT